MGWAVKKDKSLKAGKNWFWYLMVLAGSGLLYGITCAPAVLWQDSSLFVYRMWHNDIQGNLGLATSHPLYVLFGIVLKYIPFGDFAWRVNFMSSVFGAVAVANLFLLLRLWGCRIVSAVIAAVTLSVSWTFWQHAVIAEAYTMFAAQLFFELLILSLYLRKGKIGYLYLLGFLNGLSIANHMWGIFGLCCYGIFVIYLLIQKRIQVRDLVVFILCWMVGALPYEYLIVKNIIVSGDVVGTLVSAAFGNGWQGRVLNTSISLKIIVENIVFILLNFPTPNFMFLFVGLWIVKKKVENKIFANILYVMLILHFVFAFRYTVPDRYSFFLPFYCLATVFFGFGLDVFFRRYNSRWLVALVIIFSLLPVVVYNFTPDLARKEYKSLAERRQRPYRDEYDYFLKPWKTGYRGAEKFATEALEMVEKNAVIWAYTTDVHSLLCEQEIKGLRQDIKIVSEFNSSLDVALFNEDSFEDITAGSAIYVTTTEKGYCPEFLLERYNFDRVGVLYKATKKLKL